MSSTTTMFVLARVFAATGSTCARAADTATNRARSEGANARRFICGSPKNGKVQQAPAPPPIDAYSRILWQELTAGEQNAGGRKSVPPDGSYNRGATSPVPGGLGFRPCCVLKLCR